MRLRRVPRAAAAVVAIHLWTLALSVAIARADGAASNNYSSSRGPTTTDAAVSSPTAIATQLPAGANAAAGPPATSDIYVLYDEAGVPCAALSCSFSLSVPYNTTSGPVAHYTLQPPCLGEPDVAVSGSCGKNQQTLVVNLTKIQWTLQFDIQLANSNYFISGISLAYVLNETVFPNVTNSGSAVKFNSSGLKLFETANGSYYSCNAKVKVDLTHDYVLKTHNFRLLAFTNTVNTTGRVLNECSQDKPDVPNNTVPIAVGVALAVLLLIVVVSYFISRRTFRGYQSV